MCSYERPAILCCSSCRPAFPLIGSFDVFCFLSISHAPCLIHFSPDGLASFFTDKSRQIDSHRPHHLLKSIFLPVNKRSFLASLKTRPSLYALDQGLCFFPCDLSGGTLPSHKNMVSQDPSSESPPFPLTSIELHFSKEMSKHTISTYLSLFTFQPILI